MIKNANYFLLTAAVSLLFSFALNESSAFAGDKGTDKPFIKEIEKMRLKKKKGLISLDIDIIGGVAIANSTFEFNTTDTTGQNLKSTQSKTGFGGGATLSVNFFGFGFTTGMLYAAKGFRETNGTNFNLHYFNIPLLFYFDFDIDKVIVDGNLGPYFGILMSSDNSPIYKVKNFDFGLTGNIQVAYMVKPQIGPLLGFKYEYGGLNNLGNNETIKSIRTQTMFIYTGVKIML